MLIKIWSVLPLSTTEKLKGKFYWGEFAQSPFTTLERTNRIFLKNIPEIAYFIQSSAVKNMWNLQTVENAHFSKNWHYEKAYSLECVGTFWTICGTAEVPSSLSAFQSKCRKAKSQWKKAGLSSACIQNPCFASNHSNLWKFLHLCIFLFTAVIETSAKCTPYS